MPSRPSARRFPSATSAAAAVTASAATAASVLLLLVASTSHQALFAASTPPRASVSTSASISSGSGSESSRETAPPTPLQDAPASPSHAALAALASSEPGISPDGREIAFVSGGDIWTVPATGGEARLLVSHPATESRPLYSPDGRALAFVSTRTGNGDIYVLTLATGDLRRVTYDDAREALSGWSPDGRWLQYSSNSQDIAGMEDVFRVAAQGGTPFPIAQDRYFNEFHGAVSPDGTRLAYGARGIASSQWWRNGHSHIDESEIWIRRIATTPSSAPAPANANTRAASTTSTSLQRAVPMGAKALWPMWTPDNAALFYVSDRSGAENLWRVPADGSAASTAAAPTSAAAPGGRAVTTFKDGRLLWPSISTDGARIAFERNLAIWTLDTRSGEAKPVTLTRRGAPAGAGVEHVTQTARFRDLALSPDGKKIVFGARGDLFAVSAKDGGAAFRITATPALDTAPSWTADSRRLVYVAERDGASTLRLFDFTTNTDVALTTGPRDYAPLVSPNGESVAFLRNSRDACVVGLAPASGSPSGSGAGSTSVSASASAAPPAATSAPPSASTTSKDAATPRTARCLAQGAMPTPFDAAGALAWSPDSRWLAIMADGTKGFSNVSIVPLAGGDARQASFVGNIFAGSLAWSPDGTFLVFTTGQRTEPGQIARVDLVPRVPKFREDQFRDLFAPQPPGRPATPDAPPAREPAAPEPAPKDEKSGDAKSASADAADAKDASKKPKPTEVVFDDIRRRLTFLPVDLDANAVDISRDGKLLLITASAATQQNLYVYSLDELAAERPVPRQITSTSGAKSQAQFSPDGKEVFYLEAGRILAAPVERGAPRTISASAELDVDFATDRTELFTQAWWLLQENFYDPQFHGVDWKQARARFAPYAAGAATPDDLRRVMSLMIGELNASHLGVGAPPGVGGGGPTTGRLGVRFDPAEQASSGRLVIAAIIPLGPAAVARTLAAGDELIAVNGVTIDRATNLDRLLEHTINKRVTLTVSTKGQKRDVALQPVNLTTEKGLHYRAWVESRREYVAKASGGRLGYVHMPDMSAGSLTQLYADLDADNQSREGVVIDLRNNNGGFVNAYALDVFTRRPYLHMTMRGRDKAPGRAMLGQRALEAPTVLVTNQHSLSDAEDFTEGYREMKLGKVVGEPTAGWIIYTWGATLNDGSSLRLPRTRVTDNRGQTMELNPRPVDVAVSRQPGDEAAGKDTQLDAAVKELLAQVGAGRTRPQTASSDGSARGAH